LPFPALEWRRPSYFPCNIPFDKLHETYVIVVRIEGEVDVAIAPVFETALECGPSNQNASDVSKIHLDLQTCFGPELDSVP